MSKGICLLVALMGMTVSLVAQGEDLRCFRKINHRGEAVLPTEELKLSPGGLFYIYGEDTMKLDNGNDLGIAIAPKYNEQKTIVGVSIVAHERYFLPLPNFAGDRGVITVSAEGPITVVDQPVVLHLAPKPRPGMALTEIDIICGTFSRTPAIAR